MKSKATRIIIATIAVVGLAGMASPAEAGGPSQQRTVWCC